MSSEPVVCQPVPVDPDNIKRIYRKHQSNGPFLLRQITVPETYDCKYIASLRFCTDANAKEKIAFANEVMEKYPEYFVEK